MNDSRGHLEMSPTCARLYILEQQANQPRSGETVSSHGQQNLRATRVDALGRKN